MVACGAVTALGFGTAWWLRGPRYRASVAFTVEVGGSRQLPSALSAFAGQFGISLAGGSTASPRFFAELLSSESFLRQVLYRDLPPAAGAGLGGRVLSAFIPPGLDRPDTADRAVAALRRTISSGVDDRTGIVRVDVVTRNAELSGFVAQALMEELNHFNFSTRRTQARERRAFLERRVAEAEAQLRQVEDSLKRFLEENRSVGTSPALQFERDHLARATNFRQEVLLILQRELESARIEEVNDTPVLTVVDEPRVPTRPKRPGPLVLALLGATVGIVLGAGTVLMSDSWEEVAALLVSRTHRQR